MSNYNRLELCLVSAGEIGVRNEVAHSIWNKLLNDESTRRYSFWSTNLFSKAFKVCYNSIEGCGNDNEADPKS